MVSTLTYRNMFGFAVLARTVEIGVPSLLQNKRITECMSLSAFEGCKPPVATFAILPTTSLVLTTPPLDKHHAKAEAAVSWTLGGCVEGQPMQTSHLDSTAFARGEVADQ